MNTLANISSNDLDILFWPSSRGNVESAWIEHVPFGHWLVSITEPNLIVELGVHSGVSYSSFCEAVKRLNLRTRCFGIDTWVGDAHSGFYDEVVFGDLHKFHDRLYGQFSQLIRSTFSKALCFFPDKSIDLLHIDGNHTYQSVRSDFEDWLPKMSASGVILFHDICADIADFGVSKLWSEIHQQFPSFSFTHGHGLGVLAVGNNIPTEIQQICRLSDPEEVGRLRRRVSQLGKYARLQRQSVDSSVDTENSNGSLDGVGDACSMTRRDSILFGVDLKVGRSLEIGPLHRPLLLKGDANVVYADHTDRDQLIKKYKTDTGVPVDNIPYIDIVIDDKGLFEAANKHGPFEIIVASHVLEHVPDLLGWFKSTLALLRDDGRICLALPDRRYTFDVLRRPSMIKDILEAHEELRIRPSIEIVCDAYRNSIGVTAMQIWRNEIDLSSVEVGWPIAVQRKIIEDYLQGKYIDVHCWVFSPSEFLTLIAALVARENLPISPVYFRNTYYGDEEFHVQLKKMSNGDRTSLWQSAIAAVRDNHLTWSPGN